MQGNAVGLSGFMTVSVGGNHPVFTDPAVCSGCQEEGNGFQEFVTGSFPAVDKMQARFVGFLYR
jgi:hypothetical protein